MELPTTVLVSQVEMNARLIRVIPLDEMITEADFFNELLSVASQKMDERTLVLFITSSLGKRHVMNVDVTNIIDAMVGESESGKLVGTAAKNTFENVARLLAAK